MEVLIYYGVVFPLSYTAVMARWPW